MQVSKRNQSYFMTNNPELETSIKIKRKELEDAQVLIQAYEEKLAEYDSLFVDNEQKIKKMEEENVLLHVDVTSLSSELGRLTKISETSDTSHEDMNITQKKQAEMVKVSGWFVHFCIFILINNIFRMKLINGKLKQLMSYII